MCLQEILPLKVSHFLTYGVGKTNGMYTPYRKRKDKQYGCNSFHQYLM